jgi:uncharacterized protein (DUF433 family)/DNA-binding transcriptional MerR regulator
MPDILPDVIPSDRGVYNARRAAALAGIPLRTLHHWAHSGFFRPSISPDPHDYLWSWSDLLALRAIDWLRRKKVDSTVPQVPSQRIRQALIELERDGLPRHALRDLVISEDGHLFFQTSTEHAIEAQPGRQAALPGMLNLVSPYKDQGPDLLEPRPLLRIVPGKLHGEPHIIHTRITTATLFELFSEGYSATQIQAMYPDVSSEALKQAIDLERTLNGAA